MLIVFAFVAIVIGVFVVGSRPVYVGTRAGKADENYIDSSDVRLNEDTFF